MKKLLNILLSVLMVLTAFVITVKPTKASTHIDEIYITVEEPVAGAEISYECSITSKPENESVRKTTLIEWLESPADDNSVQHATNMTDSYFEAGKRYHIHYGRLVYYGGDAEIDSNTKVFINGKLDDGTMRFFIGKTAIKTVYLYVDTPVAGEQRYNWGTIYTNPYTEDVNNDFFINWYVSDYNDRDKIQDMETSEFESKKFYHPERVGDVLKADSWYYIDGNTQYYINNEPDVPGKMRFYTGKELTRVYGDNRYKTSMAIADVMKNNWQPGSEVPLGLDEVILASAENFADALAVSYASYNPGAEQPRPIVVVNEAKQDEVEKYIRDNFRTSAQIYIIGGTAAVPEKIEKNLKKDYSVKRIAGNNRYDTNLKILETFGVGSSGALLVATGTNFADSLSASATGIPMLLVGTSLTDDQKGFLNRIKGVEIYALGGEKAVTKDVESELKKYASYYERIAGDNRYETSELIARKFAQGRSGAAIAFGGNFPDGLCGGPLAGRLNAPLLLVADGRYDNAKNFVRDFHVSWGMAFGGAGVISDNLFRTTLRERDVAPIIEIKHK